MAKTRELKLKRIFRRGTWIYGEDVPAGQWFDTCAEFYPEIEIEIRGFTDPWIPYGRTRGLVRVYRMIRPCRSVEEADEFLKVHLCDHIDTEVVITPRE